MSGLQSTTSSATLCIPGGLHRQRFQSSSTPFSAGQELFQERVLCTKRASPKPTFKSSQKQPSVMTCSMSWSSQNSQWGKGAAARTGFCSLQNGNGTPLGGVVARADWDGSGRRRFGHGGPAARLSRDGQEILWPDPQRPRICILGGGFGGLYTALRLDALIWPPGKRPQVLLVDQSDRFVFKPMLYELISKEVEEWEVAPRFVDLLEPTNVRFLQAKVSAVQPTDGALQTTTLAGGSGGKVLLDSGEELTYDWLVLALGAETRMSFVPGAKEHALPFATLEDAQRVERELSRLEVEQKRQLATTGSAPAIRVAVVGAGYAGVELASTVAERLGPSGRVQLIDPQSDICSTSGEGNKEAARKVLASRGAELLLNRKVTAVRPSSTSTSPDSTAAVVDVAPFTSNPEEPATESVPVDIVLWTVGTTPAVPSGGKDKEKAFPVRGRGQADTEETLRVRGHPRVFALGDNAAATDESGAPLAATAQVAFQQADYVAWNIWAAINGRPLLPFRYQHLGEMMTLGSKDGAVSLNVGTGFTFEGPAGHTLRRLAYLYRMPTTDHMVKVGASWVARGVSDLLKTVLPQST